MCRIGSGCLIIFLVLISFDQAFSQDTTRLSLLFTGDIMGHDSQIAAAYDKNSNTYDYTDCFQYIRPYLESADLAIGNLELTLAGPPYKGYPQFSSPDALVPALKAAGFDVLVTANNHAADRGGKGIDRTIMMLDSLRIPHTGTFVDEASRLNDHPLIIRWNGFTVALLNYTFSTNGLPVPKPYIVNRIDTAVIGQDIARAKMFSPDATIVFVHWGIEYQSQPNAAQKDLAQFCFDRGAEIVIGAHPHVLQPMAWNKSNNTLVVYSLGNFVSGQRKPYTDGGAMVRFELEKIAFGPDSSTTRIDTAAYLLQWVYRTVDASKDYYILPVTTFENDTTGFIRDAASRTAFKTFARQSRALLDKYNVNIPERKQMYSSPAVTYSVLVEPDTTSGVSLWTIYPPTLNLWMYEVQNDTSRLMSGKFASESDAVKQADKLMNTGMFSSTHVVHFKDGRLEEEEN